MDLLDEMDEPVVGELVKPPGRFMTRREKRAAKLQDMEEEVLAANLDILSDVTLMREIDPENPVMPPEWVTRWGEQEASRKFRIARAAWIAKKDMPGGLEIAKATVAALAKNRSKDSQGADRALGIGIQILMPMPAFPVMKVEE
jgi:hypothetical protein